VVPKLSLETGLVYTYTKPPRDDDTEAWYFTALDFCTGRTVYKQLAGRGFGYNNNFAPVTLAADGSAYVGALGGLIRLADATPPAGPRAGAPRGCPSAASRPRLKLRLRSRRARNASGRRCRLRPVRARVRGRDVRHVHRVAFLRSGRRVARDRRRPFARVVDRGDRAGRRRVAARVRLKDGRLVRLRRSYRACAT
jgi:hypothetical protein